MDLVPIAELVAFGLKHGAETADECLAAEDALERL